MEKRSGRRVAEKLQIKYGLLYREGMFLGQ